jgi:hypothetical protein
VDHSLFSEKTIVYFNKPGKENTEKTLLAAKKHAIELGIQDVEFATVHGNTGLELIKIFSNLDLNYVAVTICEGFKERGWTITESQKSTHAFGGNVTTVFTDLDKV